jgi:hypothetical protein
MPSIPLKDFGNHGDQISVLGLGGHHLGDAEDEQTAIQIVHEAVDGGITFFDNLPGVQPRQIRKLDGQGSEGPPQSRFFDDESVHAWPGRFLAHPDVVGIIAAPPDRLKMLATGFPFDAVQMPLNAFDAR